MNSNADDEQQPNGRTIAALSERIAILETQQRALAGQVGTTDVRLDGHISLCSTRLYVMIAFMGAIAAYIKWG